METIQIGVEELLGIIERSARQTVTALQSPQSLATESLLKHIAKQYAFAERLHEMVTAAGAGQSAPENGVAETAN